MPKRPHPPPTRRKKTPKAPETADEYLAVAVDLEESGERWRSGDVAKSGRFFLQAITAYETTLARYPNNFDARYNRARLLYTLTQLPLPSTFFPPTSTPESRLITAIQAHKECNDQEPDSSDVLFNYGQTLASLAELYANKSFDTDDVETADQELQRLTQAKAAFENSWEVLKQCLAVQEEEFKSTLAQSQAFNGVEDYDPADTDAMGEEPDGGVRLPSDSFPSGSGNGNDTARRRNSTASSHSSSSSLNNTQWAAIVEPTTKLTLLDTALAMLEVHTNILSLATPLTASKLFSQQYIEQLTGTARVTIEEYILPIAASLHSENILEGEELSEHETEAVLHHANYLTGLAEVKYYLGFVDMSVWEQEVKNAFAKYCLFAGNADNDGNTNNTRMVDLSTSWMALCDLSTAYTTIATAIAAQDPSRAWRLAGLASKGLAEATKLAPEKGKPEVYLARGNLELVRSRIPVEAAEGSRGLLRKNAGVYYRGVVTASTSGMIGAVEGGRVKEVVEEAKVKEMLIRVEVGDAAAGKELVGSGVEAATVRRIVRAAIDEGVFGNSMLEIVG
ncbi:hypothetical protein TWF694_010765 [Orbilia ellipsospora]|uniref:Uncharacterized protein n=1 Tax=Orbilia ellipsospora TaxID=2528407 RepID=A0AAV9X707_9PEZI